MDYSSPAGWYPDPDDSGKQRFWDGRQWTDAVAAAVPTGPPPDATRNWAVAAHLSAVAGAFLALAFLGPLTVLLIRGSSDPYVRGHAIEALNFNLSMLLYSVVVGFAAALIVVATLGVGLLAVVPVILVAGLVWLVLVIHATVKARHGHAYRYPLTIRFVK